MVGTAVGLTGLAFSSALDGVAAGLVAVPGLIVWSVAAWGFGPPQQSRMLELAPDTPTVALAAHASASQLGIGIGGLVGAATIAAASTGWLPAVGTALALLAILTNRTRKQLFTSSQASAGAAIDLAAVRRQLVTAGSITDRQHR